MWRTSLSHSSGRNDQPKVSLAVSLLAILIFAVLLASADVGRQICAWGMLLSAITATFSIITASKCGSSRPPLAASVA